MLARDLLRQNLVKRKMHGRGNRRHFNDLPFEIPPCASNTQSPPDGNRNRFRAEAEHHGVSPQTCPHSVRNLLRRRVGRETFDSVADILQGLVRLEEEVARHLHIAQAPVTNIQIDNDKFSAVDFVFAVHMGSLPKSERECFTLIS